MRKNSNALARLYVLLYFLCSALSTYLTNFQYRGCNGWSFAPKNPAFDHYVYNLSYPQSVIHLLTHASLRYFCLYAATLMSSDRSNLTYKDVITTILMYHKTNRNAENKVGRLYRKRRNFAEYFVLLEEVNVPFLLVAVENKKSVSVTDSNANFGCSRWLY